MRSRSVVLSGVMPVLPEAVRRGGISKLGDDWHQNLALYDQLLSLVPTPAVRTARIVALARAGDDAAALAQLEGEPENRNVLAVRGDLLARLGDTDRARASFRHAADLAENAAERGHPLRRAEELG